MIEVLIVAALAATAQGALPSLAIDAFPPAARDAISRVHREARAQSDNPRAVGALASTLHAWELWEAAHEAYTRARSLEPRSFEWRYLDGIVLQRLVRHAEAATLLGEALAISPGYLPARVKLADSMLETGRVEEAKSLFAELAKEPMTEPIGEVGLGRLAAAEGRHDVAVVHLQRAVALFPELGAAHYALALSYRALGRSEDARRALTLHQQHGPGWPAVDDPILARVTALRDDARTLVQRGIKLAEQGDLEGGIAAHDAALARDPSLAQAHGNLISLHGRARNWVKAEAHYRAIVALGVDLGDAHYDYGVLLGLQDKWDLAEQAYRQALAVNPRHAEAHNNLGQIRERQRRFEEAAHSSRQAVESQPVFRLARFNLGRMLIALDRPGDAASELAKLLEPRDAETARYMFALGVAHVRAGRKEEGIKWATEARTLAVQFGQHELAAAIERDLALLK
jgi:tetratricopeptide (TPR) repeat protein